MNGHSNGWSSQPSSFSGPSAPVQFNVTSSTHTSERMKLNELETGEPTKAPMQEDVQDFQLSSYLELLKLLDPDNLNDLTRGQDKLSLQKEASQFWQWLGKDDALLQAHEELSSSEWEIPQEMYTSNISYRPPARESLPFTKVDVAASEAVVPDALARALRDPLEPAFPDIIGLSSREGKKFTFRLVFVGFNRQPHGPLRNERPKQRHERASMKTQAELAASVKAAERLSRKPLRKNSKSVPLMRIALVEMVALELQSVMKELKEKNRPLTFRGREVDFAHVKIMNIYRPTSATMQPTLEILHEYRSLYMADNAPVRAVVDQAHDDQAREDQAREDQSVIWAPAWDHPTAPTTPATGNTDVPTTPGIGRADEPCTFTPVLGGYLQYDEPFTLTPAHGSYPQCDQPFTFTPAHGGYLQCDEPGMSNIDYMQGQMPPVASGPWAMRTAANTIPTPGGPPTRYAPPPPPPFMWRPEMAYPGSADAEATLGLGFADVQGGVRTPANGNLNLEANTRTPATDDDVYFDSERYGESTMPNLWATQAVAGRRRAMRMWPNRGPRPAAAASTSACRYF